MSGCFCGELLHTCALRRIGAAFRLVRDEYLQNADNWFQKCAFINAEKALSHM